MYAVRPPGISSPVLAILAAVHVLVSGCDDGAAPTGVLPDQIPAAYATAAECGSCHPDQLAQWEASMHAYAGADPVMHALSEMAAAEGGDGSCKRCHAPAQRRQDLLAGRIPGRSTDRLEEGISCDVCHSVSGVPPVASIDFLDAVDPYGPKYANLPDPIDTPAHASVKRNFYSSSTFCAPCHQIDLPSGDGIENTFGEWQSSLLSGMGVECQTCHMPEYRGRAATDGPVRDNLHRHEVVGVDYAYEAFRGIDLAAQRDAIRALLSASVSVTAELPASVSAGGDFEIAVTVVNDRTGHSIPSGVSFSREMWVEVTVREGGDAIYRSGWLKPNGDLVTLSEDPALTGFGSRMFDAAGAPTMFTWRATRIDDSGLLRFGDSRTGTYVVPVPAGTIGPLTADLALRFRPIKPAIIRAVDLERLLPIEIFDMWTESVRVEVAP